MNGFGSDFIKSWQGLRLGLAENGDGMATLKEQIEDLMGRSIELRAQARRLNAEADNYAETAKALMQQGKTPLQQAIFEGRKADAKDLIRAGADVNEMGETYGLPPLMIAMSAEGKAFSETLAKALLKAGADPNVDDGHGYTPLHNALEMDRLDLAIAFIKAGAHIDEKSLALFKSQALPIYDGYKRSGKPIDELCDLLGVEPPEQ